MRPGYHSVMLGSVLLVAASGDLLGADRDRSLTSEAGSNQQLSEKLDFFERRIRPLLSGHCYNCHSANNRSAGGLRIDDRNGLLEGGNHGPAVVPGDPETSWLLRAVRRTDSKIRMPPEQPLDEAQIADLTQWILDGAVWPSESLPEGVGKWTPDFDELRRSHWAWQPLADGVPPVVNDTAWVRTDIDRFVIARLERQGLNVAPDADRTSLLRRVTFDLTGLPPELGDIDAFVADDSEAAFAVVVDRLLTSPAWGERWGRHWLDVARYGESTGSARNLPYPHAWRYRDYVIDSFAHDKPYDRFIREQIAGDLLAAETPEQRDEQAIATGFLALGVKDVNQRFRIRFQMDNIDEQIDTVSRSILGLTVSCARCHDHKFDPVPVTDYYALAGIFQSTDLCAGVRSKMGGGGLDYYDSSMLLALNSIPSLPREETQSRIAEATIALETAKREFEELRGTPRGMEPGADGRPRQQAARQRMNKCQSELLALTDPATTQAVAYGVRESTQIADAAIRIRGEAEKMGPVVPRGFLSVLKFPGQSEVSPESSGRRELADWLTDPRNPLAARVIVNRVWKHLFGQGLVRTVDNFGVTGDLPSHPELLDYLAARFMADGWSIRSLIREIVLSRTYQLSMESTPSQMTADPDNRLLWRHSPRRLEAEELRDAILAASGRLDRSRPDMTPSKALPVIELPNDGPAAKEVLDWAGASRRRSVYLPLLRTLVPTSLEVFDFAEQGMVTGARDTTTVPLQALYFLNDPLVRAESHALAVVLLSAQDATARTCIEQAWKRILGRNPGIHEIEMSTQYLSEYAAVIRPAEATSTEATSAQATSAGVEAIPAEAADGRADVMLQVEALQSLIQALFGSGEFRYLR